MDRCHTAVVMLMAFALAGLQANSEVETFRDDLGESPSEAKNNPYVKISGFSVVAGAKTHEVESRAECQSKCSIDTSCKSYSYRKSDRTCITSTGSLTYDMDWNLFQKAQLSPGQYRKLPGMRLSPSGFKPIRGTSAEECEAECTKNDTCDAFSYTDGDGDKEKAQCWMTTKAIQYTPKFDYFEKKGTTVKVSPASPTSGVVSADQEDPAAKALRLAEEAKLKAAQQKIADANKSEDQWKQEVAAARKAMAALIANTKAETARAVADAKADAKKTIAKKEADFVDAKDKEWKAKAQALQLQFAAAEIKEKQGEKEKEAQARAAQQKKNDDLMKELNTKKSKQALEEGSEEAKLAAQQTSLHDAERSLFEKNQELMKQKAALAAEKRKLVSAVEDAKEQAEKKSMAAAEEAKNKKEAGLARQKKDQEMVEDKIQEVRAKAAASEAKIRAEAEKDVEKRVAEVGWKNSADNKVVAEQAKNRVKAALVAEALNSKKVEAAEQKAEKAQEDALKATAQAKEQQAESQVKAAAVKAQGEQGVAKVKLEAERQTQEKQIKFSEKIAQTKEDGEKQERVQKQAARRAQEATENRAQEEANRMELTAEEKATKADAAEKARLAKAAKELDKKKKSAAENSEKELEKISKEEEAAKASLKAQEGKNKVAAKKVTEDAAASAVTMKKQAQADAAEIAKASQERSKKAADSVIALAKRAARISQGSVVASEVAYVDSGDKKLDVVEVKRELKEAQQEVKARAEDANSAEMAFKQAEAGVEKAKAAAGKAQAIAGAAASRRLLQSQEEIQGAKDAALAKEKTQKMQKAAAAQQRAEKAQAALDKAIAAMKAREQAKKKTADALEKAKAVLKAAEAKEAKAAAAAGPANQAFGSRHLELLTGNREKSSFVKFPTNQFTAGSTITAASLKLQRYSGPNHEISRVKVSVAKCSWKPSTLTYKKSIDQGIGGETDITSGANAMPNYNGDFSIPLKPGPIEQARKSGDHICLKLYGGSHFTVAILQKTAKLLYQTLSSGVEDAAPAVVLLDEADEY